MSERDVIKRYSYHVSPYGKTIFYYTKVRKFTSLGLQILKLKSLVRWILTICIIIVDAIVKWKGVNFNNYERIFKAFESLSSFFPLHFKQ